MEKDDVVEAIVEIAKNESESSLLEMTLSVSNERLYDAALEAFGGWDAALVAALKSSLRSGSRSSTTSTPVEDLEIVRKIDGSHEDPVYTSTLCGNFFYIGGDEFEITAEPEVLPKPEDYEAMRKFYHVGRPDGVFLFSNYGKFYGLDPRMIPQWMGISELRPMNNILPLEGGESIEFVLDRRAGWNGRVIHVTRLGKGKASDASEYGRALDREGKEGFLLNDGDAPVAVMTGPEDSFVFCASSQGQGIHFDAGSDMRSMGRRAVGVNVMKLDGPEDVIVDAFITADVQQIAVITRHGLAKRLWFEEFRPQGRAGSGLQVCKLDSNDAVAGVVPCLPGDDLVIATSAGRVHRFPAYEFDLMGRPAKGNPAINLASGEVVIGLSVLPCSTEETP